MHLGLVAYREAGRLRPGVVASRTVRTLAALRRAPRRSRRNEFWHRRPLSYTLHLTDT